MVPMGLLDLDLDAYPIIDIACVLCVLCIAFAIGAANVVV